MRPLAVRLSTLLLSVCLSSMALVANAASITGVARLGADVAANAPADATVFIFARASQGPRMPLALVRTQVNKLPLEYTLEDGQAMMPGMELSKFTSVDIVARVSQSGNAVPSSGDLEGVVKGVSVGSEGVEVVIDRVIP